ncbi:MAG: outer membrane protein assembly factor BamB family protein, partial [Planctomycetota bacterium]
DIGSLAEEKKRSPNVPTYRADQYFPNNCTMVHHDGVVVLSQIRNTAANHKTRLKKTALTAAYDAATGKELWRFDCVTFAHFVPLDLFVIDDLVWTLDDTSKSYVGLALRTGERKKAYPVEKLIWGPRAHQLCFRNKATSNKILFGRTKGSEFIDVRTGETSTHGWIKGMCNIGVMPANGMVYYTPHNCSCRMASKLTGFRAQSARGFTGRSSGERLLRGPAFGAALAHGSAKNGHDWPMHRRDAARTGSLPAALPASPSLKWKADLGGPVSQVVAAGDRLYVARKDAHRVLCLDRDSGRIRWAYVAGGRIDSAPTWAGGRLVFGCRDGHVYCLDAGSGELAWRFRAAPHEAMVVAMGQLESLWPVHGSLPVREDVVHCVAGRSSHLNGGMYLHLIELAPGKPIATKRLQADLTTHYEDGRSVLSDLMTVAEGKVFMRTLSFPEGKPDELAYAGNQGKGPYRVGGSKVLIGAAGLLDTSLFNTAVWSVGSAKGQVAAFDDRHAFVVTSYRRYGQSCGHDVFRLARGGYHLACRELAGAKGTGASGKRTRGRKGKKGGKEEGQPAKAGQWSVSIPIRVNSILAGADCVYVAGTRDLVEEDDPWGHVQGRRGGMLAVHARSDGRRLSETALDNAPVFDGLSASRGNVFLVTEAGVVLCFE